jgi:flagellar biosynthetic protein FliQ
MGEDFALSMGSGAIQMIIMIAGPLLAAALIVGLIVSVLQAVTQINESTLTFIPKMIAILVVLAVMAPWMLQNLQEYTTDVFAQIPDWIH